MRKIIIMLSLAVIFAIYFGTVTTFAANASDEQTIERFMDTFGLDEDDLTFNASAMNIVDYASYLSRYDHEDYSVYGSFCFSSGLNRLKFSSFTCEKSLVGYGEEGSKVGLLLYTESDDERLVLDSQVSTLGASGLYSDEIEFAYNTVQYLLVAVDVDGDVYSRVYEVTTKEESTKSLLENLEIHFMGEDEAKKVPEFDVSLMTDYEF